MARELPHHVQQFVSRRSARRRRIGALVRTNRFTLLGALALAILIPELFHPLFASELPWARSVLPSEPSFYASVIALLAAHVYLRKIGLLPLVDDKVIILPVFAAAYGGVFIAVQLALGRIGYYHPVTSFAVGVAWYFAIAMVRARVTAPRLAYIGDGRPDDDLMLASVEWVQLGVPLLPPDIHGIVYDSESGVSNAFERLFARATLRGIPVYEAAQLREMITGRMVLRNHPEQVFGAILPEQPYLRIKRLIDLFFAIPASIVILPVIAVFAVAIRLESPGPAIFAQVRLGYRGRKFVCYKLRSMRSDIPGPAYTTDDDPRITRIGRFIRKTRIDELPQIFNVIDGTMSWIGPRPESLSLGRDYQRELPYYAYRHLVRPGITGWAAVHQGNVALTSAARTKLEYDFYYLKYFSVWLDMVIVLMTIRTVLTGHGAK